MEVKIVKCNHCGFVWGVEFIDPIVQPLGKCPSCKSVDVKIVFRIKK